MGMIEQKAIAEIGVDLFFLGRCFGSLCRVFDVFLFPFFRGSELSNTLGLVKIKKRFHDSAIEHHYLHALQYEEQNTETVQKEGEKEQKSDRRASSYKL